MENLFTKTFKLLLYFTTSN